MSLRSRLRATVTTPTLTYPVHTFTVEEFTDTDLQRVTITDRDDHPILVMVDATVVTRDGDNWRMEGTVDGEHAVWRAKKACARCTPKDVYATPNYDIPT